jgi:hypothetical protein
VKCKTATQSSGCFGFCAGILRFSPQVLPFQGGKVAQYKVPQKIDLPDKIVGPLTFIQFGYLLIGGMIAFAIFKTNNLALIILLAIPIALLALALAFIKIQNQSFAQFIFNLIIFALSPKSRLWHHGKISAPVQTEPSSRSTEKSPQPVVRKSLNKDKLKQLSQQLDRQIT